MLQKFIRNALELVGAIPRSDLAATVQARHPSAEQLPPGALVLVRDAGLEKWACFRCPGGCGAKIQLSLDRRRRPSWRAETDWLGRPTLQPSVRQTGVCGCHFWVRQGRIDWCADSGRGRSGSTKE